MGNNDCFVAVRCFWELSFIPGWICVAFWFRSAFFFFLLHRLLSRMFLQQTMTCITPHSSNQISACRSQLTQSPAHSRGLRPRIQLQDWDLNCELQHPCTKLGLSVYKAMQLRPPFLFGFGWFYMFSNPSSFFFPYLIFYIKS